MKCLSGNRPIKKFVKRRRRKRMRGRSGKMELSFAAALLFLLFAALLFFSKRRSPTSPADSPAVKSYPIIGNLPHFVKNSYRLMDWSAQLIAASPTGTAIVAPFVFTGDPANVDHITKARFSNYPKNDAIIAAISDFLGRGILNINGEDWRLQRKAASYEFNTKSLRAFSLGEISSELIGCLLPLLAEASNSGEVVDLEHVLERFAFDNICSLVLGDDPQCLCGGRAEGERFFHAFDEATRLSVERSMLPFTISWRIKKWLNVGSERRLQESMEVVREFVDRCVRSRRGWPSGGTDLLSRFAEAGDGYSTEYVRDFLVSFVLAGRDTTPTALSWFFWILCSRPDVVGKIRAEVKRIRSRRREEPGSEKAAPGFTLEELREMNYLHAALSESLRLYPPVPLVVRECREEEQLPSGARVRKGWLVMYNAYAMARREVLWGADCKEYKPERWLEDGVYRPRSPAVFPAFHAGPRSCLGKDMAYIQMKTVAASVLERFDLELAAERGRHHLLMTMRMEGGLPVRVKETTH